MNSIFPPAIAVGSLLLGALLVRLVIKLAIVRSDANARRIFLASILYLSLLLSLLVLDRGGIGSDKSPTLAQDAAIEVSTASFLSILPDH